MAEINFEAVLRRQFNEAVAIAFNVVEETATDAQYDWATRYGDNSRVGGPELADSTVLRKGHDRKLEQRPDGTTEALRNSIEKSTVHDRRKMTQGLYSGFAYVYTTHWLHPIHEFGITVPARPTHALTEALFSTRFPQAFRAAMTRFEGSR